MAKTKAQIMEERKQNEYRDLMQLSQYSPLIKIRALDGGRGRAPTQYEIVYTCRGYLDWEHRHIGNRFVVRMTLPTDYPFCTPDVRCVDPPTINHPHIFGDWICIGHQTSMPVGLPLRQYVIGVGEMIQWHKATDGRGGPVDTRPLVGREPDQAQAPRLVPATPPPTTAPPPKAPAPPTPGRIVIKPQRGKIVIKPGDTTQKTK